MKFTIGYREDEDFGGYGYVVNEKHREGFNTAQGGNQQVARLLVHDMLEHQNTNYNGSSDELVALGAIYFNRDEDFCNGLGEYLPHHEIGSQLFNLYMSDELLDQCGSYSPEVNEWFDDEMYLETLKSTRNEINCHDYVSIKELKAMFPRKYVVSLLSKGYNKMRGLSLRYNLDVPCFFHTLCSKLSSKLEFVDPYCEQLTVEFNYAKNYTSVTIKVQ